MKLTKSEVRTASAALYLAIEWEASLLDAYRGWKDESAKTLSRDAKQNIRRFKALREKLLSNAAPSKAAPRDPEP